MSAPASAPGRGARPPWLRVRLRLTPEFEKVREIVERQQLHTVCASAACPNLGECWSRGTATFMIGGNLCTRRCGFCDVATGRPQALDPHEPGRVAEAVESLGLRFTVVTCVARDDLPDGGAGQMARTVRAIRERCPSTGIETLISDYKGVEADLVTVLDAEPDVLNHNLETVERLTRRVRVAATAGSEEGWPGPSAWRYTPSSARVWKCRFRLSAEPKRWLKVTAPHCSAGTPHLRRARLRSSANNERMNARSTSLVGFASYAQR